MSNATKRPISLAEATCPVEPTRDPDDQAWHDAQTRKALKEAEAGDFATGAEVAATIRKFVRYG